MRKIKKVKNTGLKVLYNRISTEVSELTEKLLTLLEIMSDLDLEIIVRCSTCLNYKLKSDAAN